jgi:hypothetical protein
MRRATLIYPSRFLTDKHGLTYRLSFDPDKLMWTFRVCDQDMPVGYAYCWLMDKPTGIRINDLKISDDLPVRTTPIVGFMRRLFGLPRLTLDYRRRGIGSALIREIITTARANGYHRITGEVKATDLARFPGLPNWYAAHGFTITRESGRILIACEAESALSGPERSR